jgi:hypothetical protein
MAQMLETGNNQNGNQRTMPRGGWRPGSGRKKGSVTRKTRDIADRIVADGESPLEVMLRAMRQHAAAGNLDRAAEIARYAAPFCHARISSITVETVPPPAGDIRPESEPLSF